jgi:hypothetical protein
MSLSDSKYSLGQWNPSAQYSSGLISLPLTLLAAFSLIAPSSRVDGGLDAHARF